MSKRPSNATLADDFMNPALNALKSLPIHPRRIQAVKNARKYVLDDNATAVASQLCSSLPGDIGRMLNLFLLPAQTTWVEMPSAAMHMHRCNSKWFDEHAAHPEAKTGLLFQRFDDVNEIVITVVEHANDGDFPGYIMWPLDYALHVDNTSFFDNDVHGRLVADPNTEEASQIVTAMVWGYDEKLADMSPLVGKAIAHTANLEEMLSPEELETLSFNTMKELSGALRLAVATIAMLNAVPIVYTENRATGVRRMQGGIKPYFVTSTISLTIPKRVRKPVDFVRRAIASEIKRKRLHDVRSHFRHLEHKPKAEGWVEGIHPGTGKLCWRKPVKEHTRGDAQLGRVISNTVVIGPREASCESQ
jgi:hypothetical protein